MTQTLTLPTGYRVAEAARVREFEQSIKNRDAAWSIYEVADFGEEGCTVHWRTNDNLDHGVPTEYADDSFEVRPADDGSTVNGGPTALGRALHFCGGGCHYGVGQVVVVKVNGEYVEKVGS